MPTISRMLKVIATVVIVVVVVAVVFYSAATFPRAIASFPVAFSVGLDHVQTEFEVPYLNDKAQVEVTIKSGSTSWRATIIDVNGEEHWANSTAQGNQTTYHSAWIALPSGRYNFTFSTLGGSLNADINIISKGGFW